MTQPTYNSTSTLATTAAGVPTLAIVGRPNVGKSTLFNRIVGSRRAIVGDEPGITRDRLYGDAEWRGRRIRIIDTGGILPEENDFIPSEIFRQARVAFDEAAAIVMVVDGRAELAGPDLELVRLLRKTGRPLFLAVNKADTEKQANIVDEFHRLGIKQMFPISAEHGRGIDDLLVYRAKCCSPIHGEAIVGYVTRGKGVAVHSKMCPNVQNLMYDAERKIEVDWARNASDSFPVRIVVHTDDRPGMLNQLTSALFDESANIRSLEAKTNLDHDGALVEMTVDVRDKKQLEKLVAAMRRISGVRDVERLLH